MQIQANSSIVKSQILTLVLTSTYHDFVSFIEASKLLHGLFAMANEFNAL